MVDQRKAHTAMSVFGKRATKNSLLGHGRVRLDSESAEVGEEARYRLRLAEVEDNGHDGLT